MRARLAREFAAAFGLVACAAFILQIVGGLS